MPGSISASVPATASIAAHCGHEKQDRAHLSSQLLNLYDGVDGEASPVLVPSDIGAGHVKVASGTVVARYLHPHTEVASYRVAFFAKVQVGQRVEGGGRRGVGWSKGRGRRREV